MTFPAAPHMDMYINNNAKDLELAYATPFIKLAPADIALLAADPAKQQRYTELVRSALLPARRTSRPHADILHHLVYSTIHHNYGVYYYADIFTLVALRWSTLGCRRYAESPRLSRHRCSATAAWVAS